MKRSSALIAVGLALITAGCSTDMQSSDETNPTPGYADDETKNATSEPTPNYIDVVEGLIAVEHEVIVDMYTDKSRYDPGDEPLLTVEFNAADAEQFETEIKVRHKLETVFTIRETVSVPIGGASKCFTLTVPGDDFTGYSVELYCYDGEVLLDYGMTAVDVSSDWNVFPRYGYLTDMSDRAEGTSRAVLDRLRKHHITGLFYYDVIDAHDKPLAGTPASPYVFWDTLNRSSASMQTVSDMISIGHEYNMNSFVYNLIFGAYDNYQQNGISAEWGLYRDRNHNDQDNHDLSSLGWETERLWLFNPGNTNWQDYYIRIHSDLLSVFDYDGLQVDSLGNRGGLYDYGGNPVALNEQYSLLLSRLKPELDTRILFNAVSGYGLNEQLDSDYYDIVYMEIWPHDGASYTKIKTEADRIYKATSGERGTVLAAYMNYNKKSSVFNRPGVNLTNAAMLAAGGSHLELGDTGMLSSEYYPGTSLKITDELADDLRRYYSFMTAYENLLRGPGLIDASNTVYVDDKLTSPIAEKDRIWSFSKRKDNGTVVCHLINMMGVKHTHWADEDSTQTEPTLLLNKTVRVYTDGFPQTVATASPDWQRGIMSEVSFTTGNDSKGSYIEFTVPRLEYWVMIIME